VIQSLLNSCLLQARPLPKVRYSPRYSTRRTSLRSTGDRNRRFRTRKVRWPQTPHARLNRSRAPTRCYHSYRLYNASGLGHIPVSRRPEALNCSMTIRHRKHDLRIILSPRIFLPRKLFPDFLTQSRTPTPLFNLPSLRECIMLASSCSMLFDHCGAYGRPSALYALVPLSSTENSPVKTLLLNAVVSSFSERLDLTTAHLHYS